MKGYSNILLSIIFSLIIIIIILFMISYLFSLANPEYYYDKQMYRTFVIIIDSLKNNHPYEFETTIDIGRYDFEFIKEKGKTRVILWKCLNWELKIENNKIYRDFSNCEVMGNDTVDKGINVKIYNAYLLSPSYYEEEVIPLGGMPVAIGKELIEKVSFAYDIFIKKFCSPCDVYQSLGTFYYWEEKSEHLKTIYDNKFELKARGSVKLRIKIDKDMVEFHNLILEKK